MKVDLKEGVSSKGNKYYYLEIELTSSYTKKIFLDKAEVELLKLASTK